MSSPAAGHTLTAGGSFADDDPNGQISPDDYIASVKRSERTDPVLSAHLHGGVGSVASAGAVDAKRISVTRPRARRVAGEPLDGFDARPVLSEGKPSPPTIRPLRKVVSSAAEV